MSYDLLEEIGYSYINGNISWACDEVRKLDDHELSKIIKVWVNNKEEK